MSAETQKATAAAAEESEGAIEEKLRSSVQRAYAMAATPEAGNQPISPHIHSEPKEVGLYNGISNRARGWKSKKGSGDAADNRPPAYTTVKRWDAVSKTWQPWDSIRRDPELWLPNGNCYVHLYGVGQSKRGPAFRIPFSALLSSQCHALLDRFLVPVVPAAQPPTRPRSMSQPYLSTRNETTTRFDLYMPAPPNVSHEQAFLSHVATRNFFAWLLGKPLVGKDLGSAMITLLKTLQEYRPQAGNNVGDLLVYLEYVGYLDMRNQPHFALAALHLAEFFQIRELYIDAFAHCAGMSDRLFLSPEYQHVSSVSRKLIRRAKNDLDARVVMAGRMLKNLLEDELSETHLGLPAGARAHLDRFRTFIQAFYTVKFGYYPPAPLDRRSSVFEPSLLYTMKNDFECLYNFLVDQGFNTAGDSPFLATGGICTLQCVQSFDLRHKFLSLPRPLPLLPEFTEPASSRRRLWLGRSEKPTTDHRRLAYESLRLASNMDDPALLDNDLVRAYQNFEEGFIYNSIKGDRPEKVSQVDARKVRWILIYAIYQTLRSVTKPPPEVRHIKGVPYHLGIDAELLPPWREERTSYPPASSTRMSAASAKPRGRALSMSVATPCGNPEVSRPLRINTEIKPDVDYFAQANRSATTHNTPLNSNPTTPRRSRSLTRSLTRSATLKRPLSIFSRHSRSASPEPDADKFAPSHDSAQRRRPTHHEIVVHGYGNGTQNVTLATEYVTSPGNTANGNASANRSLSNASKSSDGSASSAATAGTSTTTSTAPSSAPSIHENPAPHKSSSNEALRTRRDSITPSLTGPRASRTEQLRQESIVIPARSSSALSSSSSHYSTASPDPSDTPTLPGCSSPAPNSPRGPRSCLRATIGGLEDLVRSPSKSANSLHPLPLRIQRDYSNLRVGTSPDEWYDAQEVLEAKSEKGKDDVKPVWEQFSDLGGLTRIG